MALAEGMVSVTLSIGIATSDMAGEIHGLLSAADTALYRAKHSWAKLPGTCHGGGCDTRDSVKGLVG